MKSIIVIALSLFGASAFAASVGPAGCGLGNQIFHKENQVLASTTNGTSYSQMFGITSGTSGCEGNQGFAKLEAFVESNRIALSDDMARGEGETLAGVSQILQCEDAVQVNHVLKSNYTSVYPNADASFVAITRNVKSVLKSNNVRCAFEG